MYPAEYLSPPGAAASTTYSASPARDAGQIAPGGQEQAPDMPGPLQHTLLSLGVADPALLDRGADLDQASQCLLIDAADQLPPGHRHPRAATVDKAAASAALLNYALAATDPRGAQLICPSRQTGTQSARTRPGTRSLRPPGTPCPQRSWAWPRDLARRR
jgi:hypothetical protein